MKSDEILVQDYIKGRECEVFVIKKRNEYFAFPPIELSIHNSEIITTSFLIPLITLLVLWKEIFQIKSVMQ